MLKRWNKFFYRNSKIGADPDSSWKLQNEQMKTNPIFKFADFNGGGELVRIYDQGGKNEPYEKKKARIWEYAEREIKPKFLHDSVQSITENDYKKWMASMEKMSKKYIQQKEQDVDLLTHLHGDVIESVRGSMVSLDSVLSQYSNERCFWKLEHRGPVGETPLHLLFVNNTPKHVEIARMLLELYPGLAVDSYMGLDYYGETCIHFAIINNDIKALKILLRTNHCDIEARGRGKFFIPVDLKLGADTLEKEKYEGLAYYGEFPLSFAASVGNNDMYDLLLKNGANVNKRDTFGNTTLHLAVIHNKIDMYHHAVKHPVHPADASAENKKGLTPLALAAELGRNDMFKSILDTSATQFWAYSHMVCSAYPLNRLDTISPNGDTDWNSGLMKIIQGDEDSHLDMLEAGVVTSLLNKKWKVFAKNKFLRLFVFHLIHVIFLSCSVYLRPDNVNDLLGATDERSIARYVFEILTCGGCALALFYAGREIYIEKLSGFWQNMKTVPSRLLYFISCILILVCIIFRVTRLIDAEVWFLTFAIPLLWSYFLFFARGLPLTGPFVTMIYSMIKTDLLRFFIIYSIILGTSGVVFFFQFKDLNVFAFLTELGTFMTLIQMSLGEFEYSDVQQGRYPAFAVILFVVYMLLVHVLLLNMLIAMMTRTYERIASKTKKEWRRQWASIIIIMERSHSNEDKIKFQNLYSVEMQVSRMTSTGPADPDSTANNTVKHKGLLWIHDQGITKGKKKAAVVGLWKKTQKDILSRSTSPEADDGIFEVRPASIQPKHAPKTPENIRPGVVARRQLDAQLALQDDDGKESNPPGSVP
ncbi:transient receptor potential cation channel subfamily V member 5-like [Styela clava]